MSIQTTKGITLERTEEVNYGEKIMGVSFNPSNNPEVDKIKALCADLANLINEKRQGIVSGEVKRMCSVAITDLQTAQMWAVKAVTWVD